MDSADAALFARAKNRDQAAFGGLIQPFEKLVFNIAYRMLGNTEDAKDASQEVWLKAYRGLPKCKTPATFKSWVCAIANNTCLDFMRRKNARIQTISADEVFCGEDG
jgi:RNA polymerase sigma-70 factor (ECF subfamily)